MNARGPPPRGQASAAQLFQMHNVYNPSVPPSLRIFVRSSDNDQASSFRLRAGVRGPLSGMCRCRLLRAFIVIFVCFLDFIRCT